MTQQSNSQQHAKPRLIIAVGLLWIGLSTGCGNGEATKQSASASKPSFSLPTPPAMLTSPTQRAEYVVKHFWDAFDFTDTALVNSADITEQALVDYINLLPHTTPEVAEKSIASMLNRAVEADSSAFTHFTDLYERYLYDPNSPFRNEEYYIAVLRAIINNQHVDEIQKSTPRFQLEMALKNRPGTVAANFPLTLRNGRTINLSNVTAEYTVLFFNNPDCHDCARVKQLLAEWTEPRVKIVAIYTDEEIDIWSKTDYPAAWINGYTETTEINASYDLRAIPTLYLLDRKKRVVLKDVPVEYLIEHVKTIQTTPTAE